MAAGAVGAVLIKIAFFSVLCASALYYRRHRGSIGLPVLLARSAYYLAAASLCGAALLLLWAILTHQFQYTYVWNYSSTDLPLPLLLSTFYAGQEGSFLLWALFTALIGIFLIRYASSKGYEAEVLSPYGLILGFLSLMLIVKNPFSFIWESFPQELLRSGPIPAGLRSYVVLDAASSLWAQIPVEGKGLNPLLQNYWMVIHPQVLFIGFSAMAVPYAHAVAGLLKRDYHSWIRVATPWLVFGAMMLGTGIILGGYWAYETLGWGGFWGWDPVENSSLVPWLLCVAALHTTLIQRKSGTFVRTNFILSISAYIAVLYSTFLTRSGVLGDTSVHSFVDPGMWVYWLLLASIAFFGMLGFGLLWARRRELPRQKAEHTVLSREFALFLGAGALTFVALFVTIGTSSPIVTQLLKGKASAVELSYYVTTNLPLAVAIALLSGLGQLLWWKGSKAGSLTRSVALPVTFAVAATGLVLLMGSEDFLILLFVFCAAFSLAANLKVGREILLTNPKFVGGSLAHVGLALMFLGFVTSERYDEQETLSLEQGKPVEALGYTLTYLGYEQKERERYAFTVRVEKEGRVHHVAPVMYYSEFTNSLMRYPDLLNFISKDFYVAPISLEDPLAERRQELELSKNVPVSVGELTIVFEDFDLGSMEHTAMVKGGGFTIGAMLTVREKGRGTSSPLLLSMKSSGGGEVEFVPASYVTRGKEEYVLALSRIIPDQSDPSRSRVVLSVVTPAPAVQQRRETLVVEASVKPMINLVWMGTVTLVLGFLVTILRRVREAQSREQWSSS